MCVCVCALYKTAHKGSCRASTSSDILLLVLCLPCTGPLLLFILCFCLSTFYLTAAPLNTIMLSAYLAIKMIIFSDRFLFLFIMSLLYTNNLTISSSETDVHNDTDSFLWSLEPETFRPVWLYSQQVLSQTNLDACRHACGAVSRTGLDWN